VLPGNFWSVSLWTTINEVEVEDRLFKVIRHPFLQSEVFKTMFTLPTYTEGCSHENPIGLQGVKADEFQALARAMMWGIAIMDTR
jgi:hypothetical protein